MRRRTLALLTASLTASTTFVGQTKNFAAADELLQTRSAFLQVVNGKAVTNTIPYFLSADWEIYSADGTFYFLGRDGALVAVGAWDFFDGKLCKSLASEFLDRYEVPSGDRFYTRMPCGTVTLGDDNRLTILPEPAEDMVSRGLDAVTVEATVEEPPALLEFELPPAADTRGAEPQADPHADP